MCLLYVCLYVCTYVCMSAGSWRQYTFRTLCMCLLVLVSEALPDFSSVLDLLSVLAIIITMVVPPMMYLSLTSRAEVNM